MLTDKEVDDLKHLIRDSFRVRQNHDPIYIDVDDNLKRLQSAQHQVIFGRRGSGKSCLLVHFKNEQSKDRRSLCLYIETDEIKRLRYPDVLIRLLLTIMEGTDRAKPWWKKALHKVRLLRTSNLQKHVVRLRNLLDQAETQKVKQEKNEAKEFTGKASYSPMEATVGRSLSMGKLSEFEENKLDELERHLSDYKAALVNELYRSNRSAAYVLLDDFYLIRKDSQPDVIDYLHRLLRGTNFYLKVGTVRHRTVLVRNEQQTIGVIDSQDLEVLNLDRTLEDLTSPTNFLSRIINQMGEKVNLAHANTRLFNHTAFEKLVIASGGVPRDFLTIFITAIDVAVGSGHTQHLTPTHIWKAASSLSYRNKLQNLRNDVGSDAHLIERVFRDIIRFCITEKKRTCFLISQDEAQKDAMVHELILQLMDGKLIHVIEPDTSAASGRTGRYEAYTLDFSLFMEPRKRGIDIVEFWNFDSGGRRVGVRESPVYSLASARKAMEMTEADTDSTEVFIESIENESTIG